MDAEAVTSVDADMRDELMQKRFRACKRFRTRVRMREMCGCGGSSDRGCGSG